MTDFDPDRYWRELVRGASPEDLHEVGHPDMGAGFNRVAYTLRREAVDRALQQTCGFPLRSVFEGAVGVGFYQSYWAQRGASRIAGVDLSPRAVDALRQRHPTHDLRAGDLAYITHWSDFSELERSFDLVTAIDVLYHIIDDTRCEAALTALARLTRPGGHLLLTDKFPRKPERVRETPHVVRRSLGWFEHRLAGLGFRVAAEVPMFWCMDPPVFTRGHATSARAAWMLWAGMRFATKYWPRGSLAQRWAGTAAATFGSAVDHSVLPHLQDVPNLTVAVFRRT